MNTTSASVAFRISPRYHQAETTIQRKLINSLLKTFGVNGHHFIFRNSVDTNHEV